MKANTGAREAAWRRFGEDERAASEAIGYIITFGISTIILVTSLQAFTVIQRHSRDITTDRVMKEVAAQVATAVDEALRAGATYPDATFMMTITIPREVNGEGYRISLHERAVWVESDEAHPEEDANGVKQEVRGRARGEFIQRADVRVLCVTPTTPIPDGVCSIRSGEGEVSVVFRTPDPNDPSVQGVYLARNT